MQCVDEDSETRLSGYQQMSRDAHALENLNRSEDLSMVLCVCAESPEEAAIKVCDIIDLASNTRSRFEQLEEHSVNYSGNKK